MIVAELLRLTTRFLRDHPTHGVNPLVLATTPIDPDPPPPVVRAFYNEVDDECVADRMDPAVTPCLVIGFETNPESSITRHRGQVDVDNLMLTVAYFATTAPLTRAKADWMYISSAVVESLLALNAPKISDQSPGWRSYGNVNLLSLDRITEVPMSGAKGELRLVGVVTAICRAARAMNV